MQLFIAQKGRIYFWTNHAPQPRTTIACGSMGADRRSIYIAASIGVALSDDAQPHFAGRVAEIEEGIHMDRRKQEWALCRQGKNTLGCQRRHRSPSDVYIHI